ncbi:LPS export ABC transporter periplasmic protein LptC [Legionella londiniensis]|uniref:LPS export ABC transporter periplasmic protein LptC n=1 Tax=Legionella londiniensis TaxID=45068 RepID=UPI00399C6BE7
MNAAKQAAWLFAALISLACCGWYFASSSHIAQLDEHTLSTTPDTIVNQLTLKQFDANGRLINSLNTPLLKHIPANNTHWFMKPRILITQATDEAPWEINALEATSLFGGEQITFNKNVIIHQRSGKHPESTIKTEEMIYYPQKKLAVTEQEVTFFQPGNIVKSLGMKAYLDKKQVQLSRARGIYDPKQG